MTAEPRPAATVALVRAAADGTPTLLFVRRPASMRFLSGFHAFPAGALEPQDHSQAAIALSCLTPKEAAVRIGQGVDPELAVGLHVCALRELFEEVGILLASDGTSPAVPLGPEVRRARHRLLAGEATLPGIVAELGLRLGTDLLRYHRRWRAPAGMPVRYDVRVFVADAVGEPDPDPDEVEGIDWFTPAEALALAETGAIKLAPPTADTITSLAGPAADPGPAAGQVRHSPLVMRLVAPNASVMTGPGTNTYLVGGQELVVVDPGSMEPAHLATVTAAGRIAAVAVTHGHPDHVSGALELAEATGAPVFASLRSTGALRGAARLVADGDRIDVAGASLVAVETPGHASDHLCFWLPAERALFSGDLLMGEGTSVISPPDGEVAAYMDSLRRVAALEPRRLYPAHFAPRDDAAAWIEWNLAHRIQREAEVLGALAGGARTPREIVDVVYAGYPAAAVALAVRTVLAHLRKLQSEGRVAERGALFELLA